MKIVDMHCDTISRLLELEEKEMQEGLLENTGHLDLRRMKQSGYLLQNFALFVELVQGRDPWEQVLKLYECYGCEMEKNQDLIAPVLRFEDIAANEEAGRMSALLTVEEGAVCEGELEKLEKLYDMGVRMLTLTWNFPNELGYPNRVSALTEKVQMLRKQLREYPAESAEYQAFYAQARPVFDEYLHTPNVTEGLTERGREFVARMEELGMIPDVSHLSDGGFYDVLAVTRKPFAASHSNARAVCPNVRNMTDDMIRKLAERGGVMGLNYCADFLEEMPAGRKNPGTVAAVVRHARHIVNVGGIGVLGLGSDFDGIPIHEELPGAESLGRLWDALKAAGFTERELDLVFCGNVLRVYHDTLK